MAGRKRKRRHDNAAVSLAPPSNADVASVLRTSSAQRPARASTALARCLLEKWAWGFISGPMVQELAAAAKASGASGDDLDILASMGSHGQESGVHNISRTIKRHFCKDLRCPPEAHTVSVRMIAKLKAVEKVRMIDTSMLLPHDWFAALEGYPEVLGLDSLEMFWSQHDPNDPKLFNNPMTAFDYATSCVPFLLHGDGAKFQRADSLMVLSMRSIISAHNTASSQLLICAIPSSCTVKSEEGTWSAIWRELTWSLTALFEGKHPTLDAQGQPFAAGSSRAALAGKPLMPSRPKLRGVLWVIAGDNEYLANYTHLNHPSARHPCFMCQCFGHPPKKPKEGEAVQVIEYAPMNDFRPDAKWRLTIKSPQAMRQHPPTKHVVMQVPGVVGETFAFDSLHTLELGATAHFIANCLFEFVYEERTGTLQEGLANVWHEILRLYSTLHIDHSNRIGQLTLTSFADEAAPWQNFPALSGIKARQCRYLVPVVCELCKSAAGTCVGQHRLRAAMHLHEAYNIVDEHGWFLSELGKQGFRTHVDAFLVHYSYLAKQALSQKVYKYSLVTKHHYVAHLPDQCDFLNLKISWCYQGETMAGLIAALGHSVLAGTAACKVCTSIISKYRLAMHLRFMSLEC